ncbi:unnamed protein product [Arctia plantaginis]|uniref:Uncharacterized protein n=1 Tax=Arctia plantaginis TaxID=874455 RepID=A0A8S1BHP5_ARCPL|nr:unnamed protein product [Arctia plantaginis]
MATASLSSVVAGANMTGARDMICGASVPRELARALTQQMSGGRLRNVVVPSARSCVRDDGKRASAAEASVVSYGAAIRRPRSTRPPPATVPVAALLSLFQHFLLVVLVNLRTL